MTLVLFIEFLNYSCAFLGLIGKIPQIQMLLKKKSPEGLSVQSTLMELLAFLIIMSYCAKQNYPLMSYLEIVSAVTQTLVFLLVLLYYKGTLNMLTVSPVVGTLTLFYSFYLGLPHDKILDYLMAVVSLFLASSKILQLKAMWETGNSDNVSISRWMIASYMSIARVLTNLLGPMDLALLVNSTVAFILNVANVMLASHYRKPGKVVKKSKTAPTTNQGKGQQQKKRN